MTLDMDAIQAARMEVARLSQVLVHDCDPRSEKCWCFGEADVKAYEAARQRLRELQGRA